MPGKIAQEKIEEVRTASDIVEIVSGYLTLRKRGKNFFGLCPFHTEKTPSFSVNPDLQIFHCFGCKAGGNVFSFIMKIEGVTFPEAVRTLAQQAGIFLPETDVDESQLQEKEALFYANKLAAEFYQNNLTQEVGKKALLYLQERGLSREIVADLGLGYSLDRWDGLLNHAKSKSMSTERLLKAGLIIAKEGGGHYDRFRGRIMFPIHNLTGQVVAFGARRIVDDDSPKYINSPETDIYQKRLVLYGLYQSREIIRKADEVVVVEGYTDWISLYQHGIAHVVATSGTALTEEQAKLLRRYTSNVVILYDSDSAGAAAALRGADVLMEHGLEVRIAMMPAGDDPDSFVRQHGTEETRELLKQAVPLLDFKIRNLERQGKFATASFRAEATRSLLESVARVRDQIRRSFMVKDLAEKLKIEEAILWSEISKLVKRTRRYKETQHTERKPESNKKFFTTKLGAAELGLVEVMVLSPDLIKPISQRLNPDEITHANIRSIIRKIYELDANKEFIEPMILSQFMDDPSSADYLAELACRQADSMDRRRLAEDYIRVIKLQKVNIAINNIRGQIRESQSQGQSASHLLVTYQELLQEQKMLNETKYIVLSNQGDKEIQV